MPKKKSYWLHGKKQFAGQKPALALAKWLNQPHAGRKFVEDLLLDAQVVFWWVAKYRTLRELNVARKKHELPTKFWDSHQNLNETLATFTCAPQINLHELPDGERVSWIVVTEESPIALLSAQVKCVLQLIEQKINP